MYIWQLANHLTAIIQHLNMEMFHVQLLINSVLNVAMTVTMDINWSDQTLECVKSLVPGPVSNQSANWYNVDRLPHLKMVSSHAQGTFWKIFPNFSKIWF